MKKEGMHKITLTGGHLSPLLAVMPELQKKAEIVIIGRKYTFEADKAESLEYKTFQERHISFYDIPPARLQRKVTRHTIPSLARFPYALKRALSILKKEKPDAVLTFGGYVGLPVALAASMLKIPIVLHEQTQKAGLSNRIIGRLAQKICISYASSEKYFNSEKTVLTGNPLRPEIFSVDETLEIKTSKPILTIMGGSAGSHRLNVYMKNIMESLLSQFHIIHQTGDAQEFQDYDELLEFKNSLGQNLSKNYTVLKFINSKQIGWVYKNTDIFVARSGINTVQELITLSKKAVLIPLYYAQGGEQLENAKLYADSKLGTYIEEKDITSEKLYNEILAVFERKTAQIPHEKEVSAAQKICTIILIAAHEKKVI